MCRTEKRNQSGATMGIIVACSVILAILVVGLFQVTMIFGGSQELRNSVDAGALNVGKEAVLLKTETQNGAEKQFDDCLDKKGEIGLTNINRILAKSFLVNANQHAMNAKGFSSATSKQHADEVSDAAQAICDRITAKLNDTANTHPFFDEFIKRNSLKMYGHEARVKADSSDWNTACVDRDEESNLRIDSKQMPDGYNLPADSTKSISEKAGGSKQYLRGYHSVAVNNKMLSFVPFKYDEKPHLINGFYFQSCKVPVLNWAKPVPNALSTKGATEKMSWNNTAAAYTVTNPQHQYQAAIPHSFIRIKLEKNKALWRYQGFIPDKETTYGYYPGQVQYHVRDAGSGTMNLTVTLGMQYATTLLWQAVHAFGMPEHSSVNDVLLQRIREIKHDYSKGDLQALLASPTASTLGMDEGEFLIFPMYVSKDNTEPKIMIARKEMAQGMAPWLKVNATADGQEKEIASESRPIYTSPNIVMMILTGIGCKPGIYSASEKGSLKWTPGTGYDQCLGTLRISRETKIIYSGLCTIL